MIDNELHETTLRRWLRDYDIVNTDGHMSYVCHPVMDPAVEEAGRKILKAFDVRERFFHGISTIQSR